MILGTHTIVVRRATSTEDAYGNPVKTWASASSVTVTGCSVQPVQGDETTLNRETVVSRWNLYAPPATDLQATDRVEWAGGTYEVASEVQLWSFPPLSHLVALLSKGQNL